MAKKLLDRIFGQAKPADLPVAKPDPDDVELRERLDRFELRAEKHLQDWQPIYDDGLAYIFNNQLRNIEVKEGHSRIQENQIFPAITQEQALINQNRVTIKALPFEKSDEEGAKLWEPLLQWQYESGIDVPGKIIAGIIDAKSHGHWVLRTTWNPKARWDRQKRRWVGEIQAKLCRPELVCFSTDCENPDQPPWVIEYDRMRLEEAKAEFPDFEDEIDESGSKGEPENIADTDMFGRTTGGDQYEDQPDKGPESEGRLCRLLAMERDSDATAHEEYVWVRRFFFTDRKTRKAEVPVDEFTDQNLLDGKVATYGPDGTLIHTRTGEPITDENRPVVKDMVDEPVYPSFRYVCRVGDTIVKDESWPLDEHPYSLGINLPLPHTWHGLNGVEMVKGLQDVTNRIAMNMESWIRYFGCPVIIVEEGAVQGCPDLNGVSEKIRIKPGAIWKATANRSTGIRPVVFADMPATVSNVREMFLQSLRDQTGVQEIGLGRAVGGTATEAIRLETNTKLRTALQWKMVEIWIVRVMRRVQAICQEYFTPDEIRRIAGPGADTAAASLSASQFDAKFDLRLEVATSMPFDRERRKEESLTLYGVLGVPFVEPLLDAFERDDKQVILERVEAHQMIIAMQEKLQQAQDQMQESINERTGTTARSGPAAQEPTGAIANGTQAGG